MTKFNLSLVAVLAMSTFAVAGGDIVPVEEPVVVEEPMVVSTGGLYLGLAYGFMNSEITDSATVGNIDVTETILDEDFSSIMLQAGYDFNQYVGIEGRYWFGLDADTTLASGNENWPADVTIDAWGIYVKPMYPVSDAFNIYALLGYAGADLEVDRADYTFTSDSVDGFSWGIGAEYRFSDAVGLFVDYVSIYDDEEDYIVDGVDVTNEQTISAFNLGVNYRF